MRRISVDDRVAIIGVIADCPARSCTWETIRHNLAETYGGLENVWTRQGLKEHQEIYAAYLAKVKSRRSPATAPNPGTASKGADDKSAGLRVELAELQRKYDALAMQHRQVIFNASMLPGGLKLLIDPLPRGQQEAASSKPTGRRGRR